MKPRAPFSISRSAAFMPLHRESRLGIREPQTTRPLKRRERRAPLPTGLHHSARGCAPRATPGHTFKIFPQPQRGCVVPIGACGHNPVGVDVVFPRPPRVALRTRQPWAECHYPVGVNGRTATVTAAATTATQRLASLYEQKLAALEALKKSLLHQAFTGAL